MLTDEDRKRLMMEVERGLDAEMFLNSPLGRYMTDYTQEQAMGAFDELKALKRSDYVSSAQFAARVEELQTAIRLPELFEGMIVEAIEAGRNMTAVLEEADNTD